MTLPNGNHFNLVSWIRFGLQSVLILLAASGVYFKLDNRVANLERLSANNYAQLQAMDLSGTHKSHETDLGQQTEIDELTRRTTNLESVLRDLVPKVERIDTNVLVLMTRENKK